MYKTDAKTSLFVSSLGLYKNYRVVLISMFFYEYLQDLLLILILFRPQLCKYL